MAGELGAEPVDAPAKLADSQLELLKWGEVAGWAADDHVAAFAAYQASCQTFRGIKQPHDDRPVFNALWEVCRRAARVRPPAKRAARHFFEDNFPPVEIPRPGASPGVLTRYYEPHVPGLPL